ncbi:MAG: histidine kinase [Gammaproteobacteria bacterium]|nr:histidine kinase [Gammaproteobacteria bacterium]
MNIVILLLPLAGLGLLRLYESALVRQTEAELIAQAAFVAALYKAELVRQAADSKLDLSRYGRVNPVARDRVPRWQPREARLDLASAPVLPPVPDAMSGPPADALAAEAGARLMSILQDAQRTTLAGVRVVDYQGVVVASTGAELGASLLHLTEIASTLEGRGTSTLRERLPQQPLPHFTSISRGAKLRVVVSAAVVEDGRVLGGVLVSRTPRTLGEVLYHRRYQLTLAAVAMVMVVLLIAVFTSLTISRPVRALIQQSGRALRGETGAVVPLAYPVTLEVEQLSEAVAEMATDLEDRARYIRTFASHVSHEFKSPLTAIRGAAELLQDHPDMEADERDRFLANIGADAARLNRLVGRLLELARADTIPHGGGQHGGGQHDEKAVCDAADVLQRIGQRGGVDLKVGEGECRIAIDSATLESIVASLLDNAHQHGSGRAGIACTVDPRGAGVVIDVWDEGAGISKENAERIFQPFFTTARNRGGTGLGLSIVKALVNAHGGSIELVAQVSRTTFRMIFPLVAHQ